MSYSFSNIVTKMIDESHKKDKEYKSLTWRVMS